MTTGRAYDAIPRKAIWLACCISFDRGPRISNLTLPNSKMAVDHNIRCMNAKFLVRYTRSTESDVKTISAGGEMVNIAIGQVVSLTLDFVTSKTTGSGRSHQIVPALITRTTARSTQLLEDFVNFVQHSGASGDDPLLSFYRTSPKTHKRMRKILRRKEINDEIKACAVRCGLPAHYFSSVSLRKANATVSSLAGASASERNVTGGWAPESRVPDVHYDHSKRIAGALDAATHHGANAVATLNIERIRQMLPSATASEVPSRRLRRHWGNGPR